MQVKLTWVDRNYNEDGYRIYRASEPMDLGDMPTPLDEIGGNATEWLDPSPPMNQGVYYIVSTFRGTDEAFSDEVFIQTNFDPHWNRVASLLHFDGEFVDAKGLLTWSGQNTEFVPGRFDEGVQFTRTSLRSRVSSNGHPDLVLGTADFTIEFFAKVDTSYNCTILDMRSGTISTSSDNPMIESDLGNIYLWVAGGYRIGPFSGLMSPTSYKHVALTRQSGLAKLFVDGVLLGSASYPESITNNFVTLGASQNVAPGNSEYDMQGVIDEFRFTKGIARYTENFTPPNEPFPMQ